MSGACSLAISLGSNGLWWADLLFIVSVYALLALSLNLINGYARMFSLGHHGFWAMGAYAAAWLTINYQGSMPDPLLFVASCVFAIVIAAAGGLLIGLPCLRLRGDYLAIATLGFGEIVRVFVQSTPKEFLGGPQSYDVPRILMQVAGQKAEFRLMYVAIGWASVLLVGLGIRNYIKSAKGRAMLAVAQDETAAGLLGINPVKSKVIAFVAAAGLAGYAGALFAHYQGQINPTDFNFMEMVKVFLIVVLGGLGSLSGGVVAAFLLIYVEQWLAKLPADAGFFKDWWQVEYALILVLLMIFRPRGIFGPKEIWETRGWRAVWGFVRRKGAKLEATSE